MKIDYYDRKIYNRYFKSLCNIIEYKKNCDKKILKSSKKNHIFKSDLNLIKKLKLNGDTDHTVFEILKNI